MEDESAQKLEKDWLMRKHIRRVHCYKYSGRREYLEREDIRLDRKIKKNEDLYLYEYILFI